MADSDRCRTAKALVVGATGGIGSAVTEELITRGWDVRALNRNPDAMGADTGPFSNIEWVRGDAMSEADVVSAAHGVQVIVHAANPPGYRNWRGLALPMLQNAIAAARASGARLVLPGNIYNYGPDALPVISESSPQNPLTRKGRVRVEMEGMLEHAADAGVRSLILRAGDFFGPGQPASWFRDVMVKPGKPVRSVTYPGDRGVGHAWAYLPDLSATMVRLMELERTLPDFATFNFQGHWLEGGADMADAVRRVAGVPAAPIRSFPWLLIKLASPVVPLFRELLEMRYLWQVPVRLDNAKLLGLLGDEPHTPLDQAVFDTLSDLECLPRPEPVPTPA